MSIKVNIKDIEINEIFEFDKIDTKVEKVKQSIRLKDWNNHDFFYS